MINKFNAGILVLAIAISPVLSAQAAPEVSTKGGIEVEDGDFSFKLHGRIMADLALYDEDVALLNDGTEFRRARLELAGNINKEWGYAAQYDFAENELAAKDLYIAYNGWQGSQLRIGQFKQFYSLEELTSSKYITFMERSLPSVFNASRRIGVGYFSKAESSTFGVSFYGQEAGAGDGGDEGFGIGGRFTIAPVKADQQVVHLGIAAALEQPEDDTDTVRFRQRPESHVTNVRLVDTGDIADVDTIQKLGLEAAWVNGPLSLQGEYQFVNLSRNAGAPDADFDGAYVMASWFLTGESRPYKDGSFGRVKPKSPDGAWELAARFSTLNLTDDAAGIFGGEENNVTLGVNYYVNPNLRFMANYIMVDTDAVAGNDDPNIMQFRAQIDF